MIDFMEPRLVEEDEQCLGYQIKEDLSPCSRKETFYRLFFYLISLDSTGILDLRSVLR